MVHPTAPPQEQDLNPNSSRYVTSLAPPLLKGAVFVGNFTEKRRVVPLNEYRSIVTVHDDEIEFKKNLEYVRKRIDDTFMLQQKWVGITTSAGNNIHLWVELPQEIFGWYWFQVKSVETLPKEIRLKLKVIRPYKQDCNTSNNSDCTIDFQSLVDTWNNFKKEIWSAMTKDNIKSTITFLTILLMTTLTGFVGLAKYLLEYLLKLLKELRGIIEVLNPIVMSLIGLVGTIVVSVINCFRAKPVVAPVVVDPRLYYQQQAARYNQVRTRGIGYRRPGSGVVITELQ